MGETPQGHIHVHALDPDQLAIISATITAAGAQFAAAINAFQAAFVVEPQPDPEPEPEPAPAFVPWSFHSPRHDCSVTGFLDPQNQVRHVLNDQVPDVPKTWRVLYLRE